MLDYELNRNPWLRAVHDNLDAYTAEQLAALPFPMNGCVRPCWRNATGRRPIVFNERPWRASTRRVPRIATPVTQLPDPTGQLILWQGEDEAFFRIDTGGQIGVKYGHYLFMPDKGGIFLDNLFSRTVDPIVYQGGRPSGASTLTAYKALCIEERNRRCPIDAPVIDFAAQETGRTGRDPLGPSGRLAALGVRFS